MNTVKDKELQYDRAEWNTDNCKFFFTAEDAEEHQVLIPHSTLRIPHWLVR